MDEIEAGRGLERTEAKRAMPTTEKQLFGLLTGKTSVSRDSLLEWADELLRRGDAIRGKGRMRQEKGEEGRERILEKIGKEEVEAGKGFVRLGQSINFALRPEVNVEKRSPISEETSVALRVIEGMGEVALGEVDRLREQKWREGSEALANQVFLAMGRETASRLGKMAGLVKGEKPAVVEVSEGKENERQEIGRHYQQSWLTVLTGEDRLSKADLVDLAEAAISYGQMKVADGWKKFDQGERKLGNQQVEEAKEIIRFGQSLNMALKPEINRESRSRLDESVSLALRVMNQIGETAGQEADYYKGRRVEVYREMRVKRKGEASEAVGLTELMKVKQEQYEGMKLRTQRAAEIIKRQEVTYEEGREAARKYTEAKNRLAAADVSENHLLGMVRLGADYFDKHTRLADQTQTLLGVDEEERGEELRRYASWSRERRGRYLRWMGETADLREELKRVKEQRDEALSLIVGKDKAKAISDEEGESWLKAEAKYLELKGRLVEVVMPLLDKDREMDIYYNLKRMREKYSGRQSEGEAILADPAKVRAKAEELRGVAELKEEEKPELVGAEPEMGPVEPADSRQRQRPSAVSMRRRVKQAMTFLRMGLGI